MKLLLIQAWNGKEASLRGKFSNLISYSSLTLAVICSLIPPGMFKKIDVVDEYSQKLDYDRDRYDLVMISSDTSSVLSAYKHSRALRKRGAYTVIGGYHATALPDEVAKYCDTVIAGPAERAVPSFFKDFAAGCPKPFYRETNVCAADMTVPDRSRITQRHKLRVPAVIANRGCINRCKYCSMAMMWRSDPRPIAAVIDEIRSLKTKFLIFFDPNFFADRAYAIRLMKELKPLKILWVCNATADFGNDHELMHLAYKCGCRGVLIGFESLNSRSLKGVAKRFSNAERYRTIIKNIHSHGIAVNGCFVLGFDSDTEEELLALPDRVEKLGLDLCRFSVLTPYPGTALFAEYEREGRITSRRWNLYDQHHVVFKPKNISAERLHVVYRQVWKDAYSFKRIFKRVIKSPVLMGPVGLFLIGANIGFKHLGIDEKFR
ncbi:MAG: B12-binding domain-containing radical SAM protein [Ruminococcus sp.]|nr:B12-binding domain-containing radical SAM protein [Ruminococcus sp.]